MMTTVMVVAAMLTACETTTIYNHYEHTPLTGWEKNDTLTFDVPPVRLPGIYRQTLGVRIDESFPFTNLSLVVEQIIIPGNRVVRDTTNCQFADANGYLKNTGVSKHQYEFSLQPIRLRKGDSLHVHVQHVMKREILPGISDIGYQLKR